MSSVTTGKGQATPASLPKEGDLGPGVDPASDDGAIPAAMPSPDAQTHQVTADPSFFGWLRGGWTMDFDRSELPNRDALKESDPITLTIDKDGGFVIDGPRVVVTSDLGPMIADIGFAGTFVIGGDLTASKQVPLNTKGMHVTRRHLDTSGFKLPFGVEMIANGIFDLLTARLEETFLLDVSADGDLDVIKLVNGAYYGALTRRKVHAEVREIAFLGRIPAMRDQLGAPEQQTHKDLGQPLAAPEWVAGHLNAAVAYKKGEEARLEVKVRVTPAGLAYRLFGIDKTNPKMNFQSPVMTSTADEQTVLLKTKGGLLPGPGKVTSEIVWNVQTVADERWVWAGKSGPHRLFVTWADPIPVTSLASEKLPADWGENPMTPRRLEFAVQGLKGQATTVQKIAETLQKQITAFKNPNSALPRPIDIGTPTDIDSFRSALCWSLLDDDNVSHGNCGEATFLMEMALGVLGIPATQTHVWASSKMSVLKPGLNITRSRADGKTEGVGQESRHCQHHDREEVLCMAFDPAPDDKVSINLNMGEGCCEVEEILYTGLFNAQYARGGGREASHNLLVELEKDKAGKTNVVQFQVWAPPGGDKATFCPFDSPEKDNTWQNVPPGVPVPK